MKICRVIISIALALAWMPALSQVASSITEQTLKDAPKLPTKQIVQKPQVQVDPSVKIDTATAYYRYVDTAQHHIAQQQWAQAEQCLRKALMSDATNPNNSLVLSNLATLQRRQGKMEDALKNYTLAIDLTPNAVTLIANRAALLLEIDSIGAAIADFERILRLEPHNEEAMYNLGMLALDRGDAAQAESQFQEIQRYYPNSALAQEGFAFFHKMKGNYQKAAECYSDVIKVSPSANLLANRADCYLMVKRLSDASDDIASALQITPDDGYLYLLRAKLNKMRYESLAAKRDVELAIKHGIDPKVAQAALK